MIHKKELKRKFGISASGKRRSVRRRIAIREHLSRRWVGVAKERQLGPGRPETASSSGDFPEGMRDHQVTAP